MHNNYNLVQKITHTHISHKIQTSHKKKISQNPKWDTNHYHFQFTARTPTFYTKVSSVGTQNLNEWKLSGWNFHYDRVCLYVCMYVYNVSSSPHTKLLILPWKLTCWSKNRKKQEESITYVVSIVDDVVG